MAQAVLSIITGPTASGKTNLSIKRAQEQNAEILSCDSLLFYEGMDIGTAKPSLEERTLVPHHGINIRPVSQPFTVKDYAEYAYSVIQDIHRRGKQVLIVGGSGFYLKCFFEPIADEIDLNHPIRESLYARYKVEGLEGIVWDLLACNPEGVGNLDLKNPRRVINALTRCQLTQKSVLSLQAELANSPFAFSEYKRAVTLLMPSAQELEDRIVARTQEMLSAGLIKEVRGLLSKGLKDNPSAISAIGYRETIEYLQGAFDLKTLEQKIVQNTKRLVAKQKKWFRYMGLTQ